MSSECTHYVYTYFNLQNTIYSSIDNTLDSALIIFLKSA